MDVNSGQILAMANLGSYDPNNYQEIYDQALAGQLEAQYQDALDEKADQQTLDEIRERGRALNAKTLDAFRFVAAFSTAFFSLVTGGCFVRLALTVARGTAHQSLDRGSPVSSVGRDFHPAAP